MVCISLRMRSVGALFQVQVSVLSHVSQKSPFEIDPESQPLWNSFLLPTASLSLRGVGVVGSGGVARMGEGGGVSEEVGWVGGVGR